MKCPSCSATLPEGLSECTSCGVNFAKWKKLEAQKSAERDQQSQAAARVLQTDLPGAVKASLNDPMLGRKIAGAVVAAWIIGGTLFLSCHRGGRQKEPPGKPTGQFAEMRDPKTGDIVHLPIRHLAPNSGKP